MSRELHTDRLDLGNGDKGSITYYSNKSIRVFWTINPKNMNSKKYCFSNDLIEISVDFIKKPKYLVTLETFIKPQFDQVSGIRQNISRYCIKMKNRNGVSDFATPYNRKEDIKVNLCRHPSKNRSKHGAKTEIGGVYKAGGMRPK